MLLTERNGNFRLEHGYLATYQPRYKNLPRSTLASQARARLVSGSVAARGVESCLSGIDSARWNRFHCLCGGIAGIDSGIVSCSALLNTRRLRSPPEGLCRASWQHRGTTTVLLQRRAGVAGCRRLPFGSERRCGRLRAASFATSTACVARW